jgi:hypothetical protein
MTPAVWASLCGRIMLTIADARKDEQRYVEVVSHPFRPDAPLDGIIADLTKRCGGNVHDRRVIKVTESSYHAEFPGKNAVDLLVDSYYLSLNSPEAWICYDFKNMRIKPTHYTIRSRHDAGPGATHPKSWVIEGSLDGATWTELDRKENNRDLSGRNKIKTFEMAQIAKVKLLRLKQTGKNHYDNHHLMFASWEVFGTLFEDVND